MRQKFQTTVKSQTLHYRPDVGQDDDVFTIALVNIDVWLTKASCQIYKMCCFHALAMKWTNSTIRVLRPINNDPKFDKKLELTSNPNTMLLI